MGKNEERNRLEELLVDRATGDLDEGRTAELRALLARYPDADAEAYEWTAGETMAALGHLFDEPLPNRVRERILSEIHDGGEARAALPRSRETSGFEWSGWIGWAAAAAIGGLWWASGGTGPDLDPARLRASLVEAGAPVIQWTATEDPAASEAGGDVVWSAETQSGAMRIRGLTANDPSRYQYQLWIFDAGRDERFPVDGGVFDVPADREEVIVPIEPRVPVDRPTLFAVTVERPGGVVVSDRERIVLTAGAAD